MAASQITVSMDGMRKHAASDFKRVQSYLGELFERLEGIDAYEDDIYYIKDAMDALNGTIGTFFFVYDPNAEGFSDLTDEHDKCMPARFDEEE